MIMASPHRVNGEGRQAVTKTRASNPTWSTTVLVTSIRLKPKIWRSMKLDTVPAAYTFQPARSEQSKVSKSLLNRRDLFCCARILVGRCSGRENRSMVLLSRLK